MELKIEHLYKYYGQMAAVNDFNYTVREGKLLVLLGPSGCGKTTTLRCIAGLEKPDGGKITLGNKVINDVENGIFVPPENRDLGMCFQSYAIWPHMTVFQNVAYGLKLRKWERSKIKERVDEMLELVGLSGLGDRPAPMLSGGQMQRVALARSLAYQPKLLLLDEPLSNLDAKLRERLRFELKEIQMRIGITTVYVTHDQIEAVALADEIILMKEGKIEQCGSPEDIYNKPKNTYVADFIGSANLVPATVLGLENEVYQLETPEGIKIMAAKSERIFEKGQSVHVVIRPENVSLSRKKLSEQTSENVWEGEVVVPSYLGTQTRYIISIKGRRFFVNILGSSQEYTQDEKVFLSIPRNQVQVLGE